MTYNKVIKEMSELIRSLPKKKTDKERVFLLSKIQTLVEIAKELLKKRLDAKKKIYHAKTKIIKRALKQFLTALDRIESKHEEIGDTDVREKMYNAIHSAFIVRQRSYSLPDKFGMFTDEGNNLVRLALDKFLKHQEVVATSKSLKNPQDRLEAFQDDDVETSEGTTIWEYFGYRNKPVRW